VARVVSAAPADRRETVALPEVSPPTATPAAAMTISFPPTVAVGAGASKKIADHVRRVGGNRVLLVTDAFLSEQGLADNYAELMRATGLTVTVFREVEPDPTDVAVRLGLNRLNEAHADVVVALGGGSVIDAAKMISVATSNDGPISSYMGYHQLRSAGLPLIAVPTTAGTGSEATRVAVITDTEKNVKMMILDGYLVPSAALVDFELSMSMPATLTAHVGIDTLTHGIEAYVSSAANNFTDMLALSCVSLTAANIEAAWRDPDNRSARGAMALAAFYGGAAFSNSSVCLVHGMSRPLGLVFHVPHGLSNAVLLPTVTRYSLPGAIGRYAVIARVMGFARAEDTDEVACTKLVESLDALNERLNVPRLRDLNGTDEETFVRNLDKMAGDALASGSPDRNPRVPALADIIDLYRAAW
jgi:alcohol dehydrogenase class IV